MRRKEPYPLEKITLNLREGDFEQLRSLHGRMGAGKIVRDMVIAHLKRVEEHMLQTRGELDQQLKMEDLL